MMWLTAATILAKGHFNTVSNGDFLIDKDEYEPHHIPQQLGTIIPIEPERPDEWLHHMPQGFINDYEILMEEREQIGIPGLNVVPSREELIREGGLDDDLRDIAEEPSILDDIIYIPSYIEDEDETAQDATEALLSSSQTRNLFTKDDFSSMGIIGLGLMASSGVGKVAISCFSDLLGLGIANHADLMNGNTIIYAPAGATQIIEGESMTVRWAITDQHLYGSMVEVGAYVSTEDFVFSVNVPYNAGGVIIGSGLLAKLTIPDGKKFQSFFVVLKGKGGGQDFISVSANNILYGRERVPVLYTPEEKDIYENLYNKRVTSNGTLDYIALILQHATNLDLSAYIGQSLEFYDIGEWIVVYQNSDGASGVTIYRSIQTSVVVVAYRGTLSSDMMKVSDRADGGPFCDDWVTNMSIRNQPCSGFLAGCQSDMTVHMGFLTELLYTLTDVSKLLLQLVQDNKEYDCHLDLTKRVVITGFSQGAAMAALFAFHFANYAHKMGVDIKKIPLYLLTSGTPPVGNHAFIQAIEQMIPVSNRQRYHMAFPKLDEFGVELESGVTLAFNIMPDRVPYNVATLENVSICLGPTGPADVISKRNWKYYDGYCGWYTGDLVGEIGLDCREDSETVLAWNKASRRSILYNPSLINYDNVKAPFPGQPPVPQTGIGRHELYHEKCTPYDADHQLKPTNMELVKQMLLCHDLDLYTEALSLDATLIHPLRLWRRIACTE